MQKNKIFIGSLPFKTTESDLKELFSQFGDIEDVAIPTDRERGRSRGFGFVTFSTEEAANAALSLNGHELDGRAIAVNLANEKSSSGGRSSTGGRGGRY